MRAKRIAIGIEIKILGQKIDGGFAESLPDRLRVKYNIG